MEYLDFHNSLRILNNIDRGELETAGVIMRDREWVRFRDNPVWWFIQADDYRCKKIWEIIDGRLGRNNR